MPTELISKDEVVKALEEYAYFLASNVGTLKMSKAAFECLRIVRNIPAYGKE